MVGSRYDDNHFSPISNQLGVVVDGYSVHRLTAPEAIIGLGMSFQNGDLVIIHDLKSESGKILN